MIVTFYYSVYILFNYIFVSTAFFDILSAFFSLKLVYIVEIIEKMKENVLKLLFKYLM